VCCRRCVGGPTSVGRGHRGTACHRQALPAAQPEVGRGGEAGAPPPAICVRIVACSRRASLRCRRLACAVAGAVRGGAAQEADPGLIQMPTPPLRRRGGGRSASPGRGGAGRPLLPEGSEDARRTVPQVGGPLLPPPLAALTVASRASSDRLLTGVRGGDRPCVYNHLPPAELRARVGARRVLLPRPEAGAWPYPQPRWSRCVRAREQSVASRHTHTHTHILYPVYSWAYPPQPLCHADRLTDQLMAAVAASNRARTVITHWALSAYITPFGTDVRRWALCTTRSYWQWHPPPYHRCPTCQSTT
jgi:hypothetical protein